VIGLADDMPLGDALRPHPRSNLRVDGRMQIMRACSIIVGYDAVLTIDAGTFFNEGSSVLCFISTTIGPNVHKLVQNTADTSPHAPVHIGENCWIGANALILKGAYLGDGSVVAAGAVVTPEVPPPSLVVGVPARIMRENIMWTL
jgi:acetyltransferase-like isoleucine patch superfamily enzyme